MFTHIFGAPDIFKTLAIFMFTYTFKSPSVENKIHFPNDFFRVFTVINQVWIKQISGKGENQNRIA